MASPHIQVMACPHMAGPHIQVMACPHMAGPHMAMALMTGSHLALWLVLVSPLFQVYYWIYPGICTMPVYTMLYVVPMHRPHARVSSSYLTSTSTGAVAGMTHLLF